ncbi:MAG: HTH domain-containing protein [candidate division Zixibacteria bacterium]|nr:HTH domain-containing protein [candidate division Zixibacteria bacterium]
MAKADRLLLILNLLRSRRNLKASNLAKECEVSERTIFRDIQALSEARVPIYFDSGYKLLTDAFLPPLNFTVDELLTVYSRTQLRPGPISRVLKKIIQAGIGKA